MEHSGENRKVSLKVRQPTIKAGSPRLSPKMNSLSAAGSQHPEEKNDDKPAPTNKLPMNRSASVCSVYMYYVSLASTWHKLGNYSWSPVTGLPRGMERSSLRISIYVN